MKKNTMMRIAAVVLMCALVTACFASSTFARYTSEATGSATATVAKWSFTVGAKEIANSTPQTFTVDLFKTILDTVDGKAETDVAEAKIAPGTKGAFDLTVQNTSEVTAQYTLKIKPTCTNEAFKSAIVLKVDGTEISGNADADGYYTVVADKSLAIGSAAEKVPVTWEWAIGDGSTYTDIGIAAQSTLQYTVDVKLVATQVD